MFGTDSVLPMGNGWIGLELYWFYLTWEHTLEWEIGIIRHIYQH